MDREDFRDKVSQDGEMSPDDWVRMVSATLPGGPMSPELMDFLEMVNQEMRKDIEFFLVEKKWLGESPVVRAYKRWSRGERPE